MVTLPYIDLRLADRLKDREFRREWFRAALEADVPAMFRDLRETRDMTQSELAELTGMKRSAISRFESSRDAKWKLDTLLRLAEALDAKLEISVIPAEEIIARYEREEVSCSFQPRSILEVSSDMGGVFNDIGTLTEKISHVAKIDDTSLQKGGGLIPAEVAADQLARKTGAVGRTYRQ